MATTPVDIRTLASEMDTTMSLVHALVREVQSGDPNDPARANMVQIAYQISRRPDLTGLPSILLRAYSEIMEALGGIRLSRETIRSFALDRLHNSQNKLSEVTSVTESATLELMDGLERAISLIDRIEAGVEPTNGTTGLAAVPDGFGNLRAELNQLFHHLQFQDITAQQLQGVTALLGDIERRIQAVAMIFDHTSAGQPEPELLSDAATDSQGLSFNPDATLRAHNERQALIDQAFGAAVPEPKIAETEWTEVAQ